MASALDMGPYGVFWSIFIAEILMGIVGVGFFMRGKWKYQAV
jgi:Na+-driven multidrug efflux pump